MYRVQKFKTIGLLALGLVVISAIARSFWLYRASRTWPTADGVIIGIDVERCRDASIHGRPANQSLVGKRSERRNERY